MSRERELLAVLVDMLERSNTAHLNYTIIGDKTFYAKDLIDLANSVLSEPDTEPKPCKSCDESVGFVCNDCANNIPIGLVGKTGVVNWLSKPRAGTYLYAEPPARNPLTDDDIEAVYDKWNLENHKLGSLDGMDSFARAIEAKIREQSKPQSNAI
jgi:hypothetical protein